MMYFSTTLAAKLAFLLSFFISIFGRYKHLDHGSPNIEPVFFVSHNKIKLSEMQQMTKENVNNKLFVCYLQKPSLAIYRQQINYFGCLSTGYSKLSIQLLHTCVTLGQTSVLVWWALWGVETETNWVRGIIVTLFILCDLVGSHINLFPTT